MAIGVPIALVVLAILGAQANRPYFRGGALSWRLHNFDSVHHRYNVTFTYRLIWSLGKGPCGKSCSDNSVGISGPATGPENFICEKGCKGQPVLSDTSYTVTAVDQQEQWEQGTGSFSAVFDSPGLFTVAIDGHDWIPLRIETDGEWRLQTEVALGVRSDTNQPNASPLTFNMPRYTLFAGCLEPIHIMAIDPDGDRVRCRFGATREECGGVCNSFPGVSLDPDKCLLTPEVLLSYGYGHFAVTIIVEDFPYSEVTVNGQKYNDKKPFTQSPTQFLVYVSRNPIQCELPSVIHPPWVEGQVVVVEPGTTYSETLCGNPARGTLITGFGMSLPKNMKYDYVKGVLEGSLCVHVEWTPTQEQVGSHMVCVTPKQSDGFTGLPECVKLHVDGSDKCKPDPCPPEKTCIPVGNSFLCINATNTNDTIVRQPVPCLLKVLDLVFVLDSSNSIQPGDKKEMKDFMKRLVKSFGVGGNKTNVGVMTFDDSPHLVFHLGTHRSENDVINAIDNMEFGYGSTDTGKALKYLVEHMFTAPNGDRPHIPNVAVVLTDGFSKDSYATQYYAKKSKQLGISIFGVGIGPSVDPGELKNLSSSPVDKYSFIIHSFAELSTVGDKLINTTCSVRNDTDLIPTATTPRPGCYDRKNCMIYGEDVCTDYPGWSSYHCRLWCGFCNGTTSLPPCLDTLPNCVEYGGDICIKPELRIWALENCRAYCGFAPCIGTPTKATTTPTPTTPRNCEDRVDCKRYGDQLTLCHDKNYEGWVKDNCPAYCGYCVEYKEIPPMQIGHLKPNSGIFDLYDGDLFDGWGNRCVLPGEFQLSAACQWTILPVAHCPNVHMVTT